MTIACCFTLRNFAFYRAWQESGISKRPDPLWRTVGNNFIDMGVLEWCKLFADSSKGKHHWRRVISDPKAFTGALLTKVGLSESLFRMETGSVKAYRDRFLAHLDDDREMRIPNLTALISSTALLFDWVREHEDRGGWFVDAPLSGQRDYDYHLEFARRILPHIVAL